jgi:hypothetical protein
MAIATFTTKLSDSYRHHRSLGFRAADAIIRARRDLAAGKVRYGPTRHHISYGPQMAAHGERHCRWIENVTDGLRFAGHADELAQLRHNGWYLDDCGGETVRGGVWQLPGRHGEPVFVAGYVDPWNDDSAFISFHVYDDKTEAAYAADWIAERMAEQERDYQRAASAGFEHADLEAEIADRRRALLDLLAERRAAPARDYDRFPAIRAAICQQIGHHLRRIGEARARQAELREQFGDTDGFRNAA